MFGMLSKRETAKKQKSLREKRKPAKPEPEVVEAVEEEHVKFMHLRRWDCETERLIPTGGITLAYVEVGGYYKVGAAFCSLHDMYQHGGTVNGKPVGRDLALDRLRTDYSWVPMWHMQGDFEDLPQFLDCDAGRAWMMHSYRNEMNFAWYLDTKYHRKEVSDMLTAH